MKSEGSGNMSSFLDGILSLISLHILVISSGENYCSKLAVKHLPPLTRLIYATANHHRREKGSLLNIFGVHKTLKKKLNCATIKEKIDYANYSNKP